MCYIEVRHADNRQQDAPRQVKGELLLTALSIADASPCSCQKNLFPYLLARRVQKFCVSHRIIPSRLITRHLRKNAVHKKQRQRYEDSIEVYYYKCMMIVIRVRGTLGGGCSHPWHCQVHVFPDIEVQDVAGVGIRYKDNGVSVNSPVVLRRCQTTEIMMLF